MICMAENKRFTRRGYSIWDNLKNEEFYELNYRHQCEDMCDALNEYEDKLNGLSEENRQLKSEIKKLDTFKKILDFAEKDMDERADWQAYCEKEFGGL